VLCLFARLARGVAHGTPDGVPVDLVFLLAGPLRAQRHHLPLLAHIVRLLHGPHLLERLRGADSPEAVLEAWREAERLHG
jgi:mannitol/fructose-specific phosphotransferase system IIA component (Ntr-type)